MNYVLSMHVCGNTMTCIYRKSLSIQINHITIWNPSTAISVLYTQHSCDNTYHHKSSTYTWHGTKMSCVLGNETSCIDCE